MNSVILSGVVLKQYADVVQASGHLFMRLVLRNRYGVFVAVGYDSAAMALARARVGARVVVRGLLRQRRPNGRTLWEIVVERDDDVIISEE